MTVVQTLGFVLQLVGIAVLLRPPIVSSWRGWGVLGALLCSIGLMLVVLGA